MHTTSHHRALAEKFMYKGVWEDTLVPDSLLELVKYVYSEEEAQLVVALGVTPLPALVVARKVKRPLDEVAPVLKRLGERNCVGRLTVKGVPLYGFMPLAPGVFEAQMALGEDNEYSRTFARLFEDVYKELFTWLKPKLEKKEMKFGRIIPIERSLEATPGLGVLAFATDRYSELVDRNKKFCLVHTCACRHQQDLVGQWCGKPKDVCSAMGLVADFAVENGLARRVSKEEFLDAKQRAAEAGLVNMVDNLKDPMQVCSCCGCCCGGLRILTEFNIPSIVTQSHFEAVVNLAECEGCQACEKICPMKAITIKDKKAGVDPCRCIGCGLCVLKCDKNKAMGLRERKGYQPPAETFGDYFLSRYLEYKGFNTALTNRLSLGLGRAINKLSPVHLSGPKYKGY